MVDTVRRLDEVMSERPVDALYIEMGDSAMIFRVRWWMGSYVDTRRVQDKVHTNIQAALNAAGIVIAFPQQDIHLQIGSETVGALSQVIRDERNGE
jgi:potassium efflux system protein